MGQRIKELAKQARLPACHASHPVALGRFAELIRADEREAIIDICEGVEVFDETMRTITEAIRQRGEK